MIILFCDNTFNPKEVDEAFVEEYEAAKHNNLTIRLINIESIIKDQNAPKSIAKIRAFEQEEWAIYRGWMLKPSEYKSLYEALLTKNIRLINTPDEYKFCHYLPHFYPVIKDKTPKSVWLDISNGYQDEDLVAKAAYFEGKAIIVKDYVKSQKHYWNEACFIPNANDVENVLRITKKFIALQGSDLNIGIVYRAFIDFEPLITHSISGMPLTKEYRLFIKNQSIIHVYHYWDEGEYPADLPDLSLFDTEIQAIKSHFYTMDIAKTKDGNWLIVELGDGQVAGLPDNANKIDFYASFIS